MMQRIILIYNFYYAYNKILKLKVTLKYVKKLNEQT